MSLVASASHLLTLMLAVSQVIEPVPATSQISGRVLNSVSYEPLSDARVFIYPVRFRGAGPTPVAITNRNGEYVFEALRPGSYTLGIYKIGFFPSPGVGTASVSVAEGERHGVGDLFMSPGAVLAGRVFDESGRPLKNAAVGALRVDIVARLDQAIGSVVVDRTNQVGEYRVQSLRPGQYVVVVNPIGPSPNGATDSMTYFPGTLDLANAQLVTVALGATVGGLDFKMIRAPKFEVSGIAVDEAGKPVSGALIALDADWPLFGGPKGASGTDAEGRFRIAPIAAGYYMLTATRAGDPPKLVTHQTPFVRVNVADANVSGLVIRVPIR